MTSDDCCIKMLFGWSQGCYIITAMLERNTSCTVCKFNGHKGINLRPIKFWSKGRCEVRLALYKSSKQSLACRRRRWDTSMKWNGSSWKTAAVSRSLSNTSASQIWFELNFSLNSVRSNYWPNFSPASTHSPPFTVRGKTPVALFLCFKIHVSLAFQYFILVSLPSRPKAETLTRTLRNQFRKGWQSLVKALYS